MEGTSGGPLPSWVRAANAARLHLSPHDWPSVTMAAVGRMAASTRALWRLFRVHLSGICPGQVPPRAPRPTSTNRANDKQGQRPRVKRCAAPAKARNQRPIASPPLLLPTHTQPLDPGRCLQPRRHRRQRRRLDALRARARCRRVRHHPRPRRRLSRASDRRAPQLPKVEPAHSHSHST